MSLITVQELFIYPVKGLTPQACSQVMLTAGHGILGDRGLAFMFIDGMDEGAGILEEAVPWMSKKYFAVQNDWPPLAMLDCEYDPQTGELSLRHPNNTRLTVNVNTPPGRDQVSAFVSSYLETLEPTPGARHPKKMPVKLVGNGAGTTRYPDREPVHISIISQATLDQLSEIAGTPIESQRFRPNIVVTGLGAWEEFNLVGEEIQLGSATIAITARIGRCANIEVNPKTGLRDLPLLKLLQENYGHLQTGVLGKVITSGSVSVSS